MQLGLLLNFLIQSAPTIPSGKRNADSPFDFLGEF